MRRFLLQSLIISVGFYAHSGDVLSAGTSGSVAPGYLTGTVYVAKPQVGAYVVVKSVDGVVIGTAITDSTGQYQVPSDYTGLVLAQAKSVSGQKYYGIGRSGLVNVTPLSSIVLTEWFKAKKQKVGTIFSKFSASTPLPSDYDLEALGEDLLIGAIGYTGATYVDLIHDTIGPEAQQMLSNARFNVTTAKFAIRVGNQFKESGTITAKALGDDVVFNNKSVEIHHNDNNKPQSTRDVFSARVSVAGDSGSNESWMGADMPFIANKRLADIAIPGTHDAGTANIKSSMERVSRTQDNSVLQQLKDGIRYLDLRIYNNRDSGKACPIPSDYYIYHNSEYNWYDQMVSYRLNEVLDQIKSFVNNPANSNEILILDFQNIDTQSDGSDAQLFSIIQSYLKGSVIPNTVSTDWGTHTVAQLSYMQTGKVGTAKVILLVDDKFIDQGRSGCGVSMETGLWYKRLQRVNGRYRESREYLAYDTLGEKSKALKDVILEQLSKVYASKTWISETDDTVNPFDKYRDQQKKGWLNVLNFAPRPNTPWYIYNSPAGLAKWIIPVAGAASPSREYLTDYSERLVNKPFNINGYCNSGTIGKYSWVGGHANKNSPVGEFNKPNVFMVDKYNSSSPFWVSVDYDPVQGKWVQTAVTDFTTFIRNLNKPQRNEGATVASMDDEACLSK